MRSGLAPTWCWRREKPKLRMACEDQSGMDREDERAGDRGLDPGIFETDLALCRGCGGRIEGRSRNFIAGERRAAAKAISTRAAQAGSPRFAGEAVFVRRAG